MRKRSSTKKEEEKIDAEILEEIYGKRSVKKKNPHAVALGRKGGLKSGKARLINLSPEQRTEIAKKAAIARWSKAKTK